MKGAHLIAVIIKPEHNSVCTCAIVECHIHWIPAAQACKPCMRAPLSTLLDKQLGSGKLCTRDSVRECSQRRETPGPRPDILQDVVRTHLHRLLCRGPGAWQYSWFAFFRSSLSVRKAAPSLKQLAVGREGWEGLLRGGAAAELLWLIETAHSWCCTFTMTGAPAEPCEPAKGSGDKRGASVLDAHPGGSSAESIARGS